MISLKNSHSFTLLAFLMAIWLFPDIALAKTNNSVSDVICEVYNMIRGPIGTMIAILGVISLGLVAMFGRIQISSVLVVMAGISLIFGADEILARFNVGISNGCGTATTFQAIQSNEFFIILSCIAAWFIGPLGKAIASVSLITIGLFATFGKVSWHQAILVAVGIATIFGSVSIVATLGVPINGGDLGLKDVCVMGGISTEMMFCNFIGMMVGPVGKGIATTGLVILGIGALFAKISWPIAMVFAVGVALIFGAPAVVRSVGAGYDSAGNAFGCHSGQLDGNGTGVGAQRLQNLSATSRAIPTVGGAVKPVPSTAYNKKRDSFTLAPLTGSTPQLTPSTTPTLDPFGSPLQTGAPNP
jgi:type IV secretion system protein VirB2